MISFRFLILLLALLALNACDNQESTTAVPDEPTKPAVSVVPAPAAEVAPVPAPKPVTKPVAKPVAKPPSEPVRPAPKPAVAHKPQAKDSVAAPPLKTDLDLSLPPDLFEELQALVAPDELPSPALLPPLFRAEEALASPFQLNGKLITNERGDDYWDSLEGAELQFEFKR
jgi:hypothetical protein